MSFLAELMQALTKKAVEGSLVDQVGKVFMDGAEKRGTFTQGKDFAKTPEGLAAQFNWGKPSVDEYSGIKRYFNPDDPGAYTTSYPVRSKDDMLTGYQEFDGKLPSHAKLYNFDTAPLTTGSGQGTRAYAAMYGDLLRDPDAFNIKEYMTGSNSYRNNYNLASAIMRQPDAGKRLLTSPDNFQKLPVDPTAFRTAPPERQVGGLQIEGALQTLQRMMHAQSSPLVPQGLKQRLDTLPSELSSTMSPNDLRSAMQVLEAVGQPGLKMSSLRSTGPRALRRLGIVNDVQAGYPVDPAAFRGLEFCGGGLVQAREVLL